MEPTARVQRWSHGGGQFLMSEVPLQGRGWSLREGAVSYPRGTPVGQGVDPGVVERGVGPHGLRLPAEPSLQQRML